LVGCVNESPEVIPMDSSRIISTYFLYKISLPTAENMGVSKFVCKDGIICFGILEEKINVCVGAGLLDETVFNRKKEIPSPPARCTIPDRK